MLTDKVISQTLTTLRPDGKRYRRVRRSPYTYWTDKDSLLENIRDAIAQADKTLFVNHLGTTVFIRTSEGLRTICFTTIYKARWGFNNKPYQAFYGEAGEHYRILLNPIKDTPKMEIPA